MTPIGRRLASILRTLAYGWVAAFGELARRIVAFCRRRRRPRPSVGNRGSKAFCVPVDHPAFTRPDPLIYDQYYLQSLGLAVTWDNPDIVILRGGVAVPSGGLTADTEYEVRVRVWNGSADGWVVQMPVHLSYLDFGIGGVSVPIATEKVSVGVKGSPSQPGFVSFAWRTPSRPGHYCLQALLDPADDANYANNLGQENTQVAAAHSPAEFEFVLRNDTGHPRQYRFVVDAYEIGPPQPCPLPKRGGDGDGEADRQRRLARHRAGAHPLPAGWDVALSPSTAALDAEERVTVAVRATPPAGWTGQQAINVNAFHEGGLAGGVTLTVTKDGP